MRIWDIHPSKLCMQHLLGEHRELHAIWSILQNNKKGYSKHPETLRWAGKTKALYERHEKLVKEMLKRGYCHCSPLDKKKARGLCKQDKLINTRNEQLQILKDKNCDCPL